MYYVTPATEYYYLYSSYLQISGGSLIHSFFLFFLLNSSDRSHTQNNQETFSLLPLLLLFYLIASLGAYYYTVKSPESFFVSRPQLRLSVETTRRSTETRQKINIFQFSLLINIMFFFFNRAPTSAFLLAFSSSALSRSKAAPTPRALASNIFSL